MQPRESNSLPPKTAQDYKKEKNEITVTELSLKVERLQQALDVLVQEEKELRSRLQTIKKTQKSLALGDSLHEKKVNGPVAITRCGQVYAAKLNRFDSALLTEGQIIAGLSAGVSYSFDCNALKKTDLDQLAAGWFRGRREKMMSELQLAEALVVAIERAPNAPETEAYRELYRTKDAERMGKIAEQMVYRLLQRVAYDFGSDLFSVEPASAAEDVEAKMDFKVVYKGGRDKKIKRGVAVEADEKVTSSAEVFGIQFTLKTSAADRAFKARQIENTRGLREEIADTVLVSINLDNVLKIVRVWEKDAERYCAPEEKFPVIVQQMIVREVLRKIAEPSEIDVLCRALELKKTVAD